MRDFDSPEMSEPPYLGLQATFEYMDAKAVASATRALLTSYINHLTTLIGERLTGHLLRTALINDVLQQETRSTPHGQ